MDEQTKLKLVSQFEEYIKYEENKNNKLKLNNSSCDFIIIKMGNLKISKKNTKKKISIDDLIKNLKRSNIYGRKHIRPKLRKKFT